MKRPWLATLRLEAEDVLAMHLFPHSLNGLLQGVLLEETEGSAAGGPGEQAGQIRLAQPSHGPNGGVADTLDEAKAAFRAAWVRRL